MVRQPCDIRPRQPGRPGASLSRVFLPRASLVVLASGIVGALGNVALPRAAWAQCNGSSNPPPAAPPPKTSFSNQSFGTTPPLAPYVLGAPGATGCDGGSGGYNEAGGPGIVGQAGGPIVGTNTGLTIIGGGFPDPGGFATYGAVLGTPGGAGGAGGYGGANSNGLGEGGPGGVGGSAGPITVQFDANFVRDPNNAANPWASTGLNVQANGGGGGRGGDTANYGIDATYAGPGGAGGVGGQVALTASGSVTATSIGVLALARGGDGGGGGTGPQQYQIQETHGGAGGNGGNGGTAAVEFRDGQVSSAGTGLFFGLQALARGGAGGSGGLAEPATGSYGGNAGNGGNGGTASVRLDAGGTITATNQAQPTSVAVTPLGLIYVDANGGGGGDGGSPSGGGIGTGGGSGGNGGNGGTASATVLGAITLTVPVIPGTSTLGGQAVLVQSNGGAGGNGAGASGSTKGEAGGGGFAGAGGSATLTLGDASSTATIRTNGEFTHGALVQSVGGSGGSGGSTSWVLSGAGGSGAQGGNGGPVTLTSGQASVIVSGTNSAALIAQSIGGGGGSGGDASGITAGFGFEVGGNGGNGGNGGAVQVNLGQNGVFASTSGQPSTAGAAATLGGAAVLAQSVGGAGGNGGSASSIGGGILTLVIGGDAAGGGAGGPVSVTSGALVTTYGDHAAGLQAQSIGGGGGKGGAGTAFTIGVGAATSVAIGGRGGGGGPAGDVGITNTGQISTYGADADGVLLQSIGGGGGSGGAATARSIALSPSEDVPAIAVSVATGGLGGAGNTGGRVTLTNSGLVTTAGDGAIGVMAQSVGGGGGSGGDATAASYSNGPKTGITFSASVAVGGAGGVGGTGGPVSLSNSGLIATLGEDAYGVFAQSVGGGGGTGGTGNATSVAGQAKNSFSVAIGVGGTGGTGGNGGTVTLSNTGAITTVGDMAPAVFAQSVGGGGGTAGGGAATANGSKLSIAVGVGGSGGAGGTGNTVTLGNSGSIVTRGTDSKGLVAQSVGGGGGTGGTGGATAGGINPDSSAKALFDTLAAGLNFGQKVTDIGNGILQIGVYGQEIKASYDELKGIFTQPQATFSKIGSVTALNFAVSVGGSGGAAGGGGAANVTNTGAIGTFGAESDAVYAQSIGGGGGNAGAATSTGKAGGDVPAQASVAVGGNGGGGGSGGPVTVVNGTGGTILTQGVLAFGVFAQSVGAGGGDGAAAGTVDGSLKSLGVGVGGNGGGAGDGGAVSVTTGDGTGGSSITTTGKHGIGIYAQSLGGGGGVARTMTTDQTFDPAKIINNPQGRLADVQGLSLTFGGRGGSSGKGGPVQVTTSGPITTSGLDAHGILAQSIGGGGGLGIGGQDVLAPGGTGGSGGASGDGGIVTLTLNAGTAIGTSGDGAHGVIAQSIGGGGGFAGDPSTALSYQLGTGFAVLSNSGNGGAVSVALNGASVTTSGNYAPAIFAQSIGGGGGLVNYSVSDGSATKVQSRGTAGGQGAGGAVTVSLVNSAVTATGLGSAGILAQSDGTSRGAIQISIDKQSSVRGGTLDPNGVGPDLLQRDVAAIRLLGGAGNTVTNAGTIEALAGPAGTGFAVLADGPVAITNTGTIRGYVNAPGTSTVLDNRPGGVLDTATVELGGGVLRNAGTLHVGGVGVVGQTTVNGDLVQSATGRIVVDVAAGPGTADHLQVNGKAVLDGSVVPVVGDPSRLRPGSRQVAIVTATGGLTQSGVRVALATPVVQYGVAAADPNTLALSYNVDYAAAQALAAEGRVTANRQEVGRALNTVFADDAPGLAALQTRLVGASTAQDVAATLDAVSGEAAADAQQAAFAAQQGFTTTILRHVVGEERAGGGAMAPYAAAGLAPVAGPPTDAAGVRVWVGGFGGSDLLSGTDGQGSLHSTIAGAQLGVDKWFGDTGMVGLSIGGGSLDFSVADRASQGHATALNLGAYGLARFGDAYVSGVLAYGNYATDLRRTGIGAAVGLAAEGRGSLSDDVLGGRVELGWRRRLGAVTLTPFAALQVDHLWQGSFTEAVAGDPGAAGLAVRFARREQTSVPLTLGARVGSAFPLGGARVLSIAAELGWVHEFNPQRSVSAAFVAAPNVPFTVLGVSASRDAAQLGLDAKLSLTPRVALLGSFTGRFSGVETAVGGFGGLQVTW